MRIILYTGKGGVGKTSVSAATALRCAQRGYRTIVVSTDAAHSLADSFDMPLGAEPTPVAPNLWAQEISIYHEVSQHWGTIQSYVQSVLTWQGLDRTVADEMAIFPGMEELSSLLLITKHHDSQKYDVIIIDSAPTGETLRLLSFPEVARWWLKNIFPIQRQAYKLIRPIMRPFTDLPVPGDDVMESIKNFLLSLDHMHRLLSDQELSTVRLVLNPEKMVIKEAQRTYTYLNLYGYKTDAIICNRVFPEDAEKGYFHNWREIQEKYNRLVDEAFSPVPIFRVPFFDDEVVGTRMLERMGESLFDDTDPAQIYYQGATEKLERLNGHYVLSIPLPFVSKEEVNLVRKGEELVVQVGNWRRNLILPHSLMGLETLGAKMEDHTLHVRFGESVSAGSSRPR
ncbi:MAG: ArsA family ATPase [Bacteroidetes bacterium]|nr:ArsA family ATPase [Bacteroidota bacterium]MCL5027151.1 ArsA family ATPase [Chloroflexota bacterium]